MMSHWSDRLAVFDTETTGLSTRDDRIVTAFVGLMGPEGSLSESHSWLADPGIVIPPAATAVHGVSTERAQREGAPAVEVVTEVVTLLRDLQQQGVPLVVYNASYDLSLCYREALRYGIEPLSQPKPVIDPLVIDRALDPYRKGKRTLDAVATHYGVVNPAAHNAEGDALTTGLVTRALVARFPEPMADLAALHDHQVDWAHSWAENFRRYLENQGRPARGLSGAWPLDDGLH
ncbi:exonuclease domain-containing protein [Pontimonas sp.]|jgi:DNA polymerase-3 subunit epsilon|uniref:exonuclease domain-containing protein n=2 Tax=Pontimonas sp. TaxID=2304492 RepID=UPI002870337E|nr:exonuclease domain-containing protein [Pontimonas sp.]